MGAFDFVTLYGIKKDVEEIKETGGGGSGESTVAWRPRVSEDGDLSWTRSSSSTAPDSVNIKGEKGDPGDKGDPGEKGDPGDKGDTGEKGDPGDKGDTGEKGDPGQDGENGKSAYDIWLELGNTGTEEDFLNSLQGEPGEKGADGTMSFEDLTDEQKDSLKGTNGKSAYDIWLEKGNTGTEEEFLESLKGADGKMSFDDLTDEQRESLKGADGKSAYQIWLDEGNTGTEEEFLESLKGDGADVEFDDVPTENSDNAVKSDGIFKALGDKQDNIIILEGYKTQEEDGFGNYIINPAPNYTNKELLEMLELKKRVVLRIYNGVTWVELYPVRNGNSTATYFVSPVWNTEKEIQELNVAFCSSTAGWKIGVNPVVGVPRGGKQGQVLTKTSDGDGEVEWSGSSPEPFIIKSSYTDTSEGFVVDTSNTVPVMWSDWYEHYLTGRQIIWELHKNTIDSGDDVIKMYINSIGIYDTSLNVLEAQFTGVGTPTRYNTLNTNLSKFLYVAWFRSGSNAATNYKKVKRFLINEIPTGGTTGQILAKKSDANYDVEWADVGGGGDVEFDDAPTENSDNAVKSGGVFEALKGKQDCVTGGVSGQFLRKVNNSEPSRFEWVSHSNFVITGEVAFDEGGRIRGVTLDETYSLAKYAINEGQAVLCSLQDRNDSDTWYHLSLVRVYNNKIEFEGHLRKEDSIDTVYFSMDSNENYIGKRYTTEYMPKVTGTYGQIIGFDEDGNCIAKEEGEATKPYVVKMYYTLTDNQFQAIPASRTAKWSDWYPFYEAGGEVILELHKDSVDSGDDIIRLYAHSKGIYNKTYNTLEVQFTAIGETTTYGNSDHTKYLYVCWWQSGNSCKVQRFLINEIPTGGTTGQALVKKSDTNYDVEWADVGGDEIIHTDLSGNLEGITTVLDLVNTLLEEYRAKRKNVRFECGSLSNTNLTDLPQAYGYLTIKVGGTNIVEVTFAYSNLGFKALYCGFLDRTAGNELFDTLTWEKVATKSDLDVLQTQIDELKSKIN